MDSNDDLLAGMMWNTQGCSCRPTILLPKQKIVPYSNCKNNKLPSRQLRLFSKVIKLWQIDTNFLNSNPDQGWFIRSEFVVNLEFVYFLYKLSDWLDQVTAVYLGHGLVGQQTGACHVGRHRAGDIRVTWGRKTDYFSLPWQLSLEEISKYQYIMKGFV